MQLADYSQQYESKRDEELLLLLHDIDQMMPEARAALQNELSRRGIQTESVALRPVEERIVPVQRREVLSCIPDVSSVDLFLRSMWQLYRENFWLFSAFVAPVVVLGSVVRTFARRQATEMGMRFLTQIGAQRHSITVLEIWSYILGSYFIVWVLLCISYAATVNAISCICSGRPAAPLKHFIAIRRCSGAFFLACSFLFMLGLIALGLCNAVQAGLFLLLGVQWFGLVSFAIMPALYLAGMLVVSRLALCIPAVILGNCTFGQSMFRSDELTEGKWDILAVLLVSAIVGGYIAAMLPFWIAEPLLLYAQPYSWIVQAASIAGVALVLPIVLVGLSLLYVGASQMPNARSVSARSA